MPKTTEQLCKIASFGGGMMIDGSHKTTEQLCEIASYAAEECKIIIKNADTKTTDQLCKIASFGKGNVVFDL